MIEIIISNISRVIVGLISAGGYAGIFILMFLESAAIPIPSEIIMPFSGFLASTGRFGFWPAVFTGTLGNIFGSLFLYWIASKWGRQFFYKYGKFIFLSSNDLSRADKWFMTYGTSAVFFGRLLPLIRTYISFPAGFSKMRLEPFVFFTALGALPWTWVFTLIGLKLGENWGDVSKYFRFFDIMIAVIILAAIILHFKKRYNAVNSPNKS